MTLSVTGRPYLIVSTNARVWYAARVMRRCAPLYTKAIPQRTPRAHIELSQRAITIVYPDGGWRELPLHGARFAVQDATATSVAIAGNRFVRHLIVENRVRELSERMDILTPPERGSIAPRVARLPRVPDGAAVIDTDEWDAAFHWLDTGGRLGGHNMDELARLARIASPDFAQTVGRFAAQLAAEALSDRNGPMRRRGRADNPLRPLERAAERSPRAANAWLAATHALA